MTASGAIGQSADFASSPRKPFLAISSSTLPSRARSCGSLTDNGYSHFDWQDVPGASEYELSVRPFFGNASIIDLRDLTQSGADVHTADFYAGVFVWKVRALVEGTWCDWSEGQRFNVVMVEPTPFVRGDVDVSGAVDGTDAISLLLWLWRGGNEPSCAESADVNNSGVADSTDAIAILTYYFLGDMAPAAPFPECGLDDEASPNLSCESFSACEDA